MNSFIDELKKNMILKKRAIKDWYKIEAEYNSDFSYNYLSNNWSKIELPVEWSEKENVSTFFKSEFEFPNLDKDDNLWTLVFENDGEAVLTINGEFIQGIDRNHKEISIDKNKYKGKNVELIIEAALDRINKIYLEVPDYKHLFARAEFRIIKKEAKKFHYSIISLVELKTLMKTEEEKKYKILEKVYQKLKEIYYREKRKKDSVDYSLLNQIYKNEIEKIESENNYKIACFGHAHIDVAWLWQFKETVRKSVRSFSTALNLINFYPEFKFIQSQPKLYQYIEKYYPDLFARIKAEIKTGNWQVEGAMWVEADTNLISGESLVRQFLYGKKYIREKFASESKILWLPDVFGYTASLPQIMKKAEVDYFMTSKISWNDTNDFPYSIFNWVGIDGSSVLTHVPRVILPYTYNGEVDAEKIKEVENNYEKQKKENKFEFKFGDSSNFFKKDRVIPDNNLIYIYGYGDGGGGVTEEFIEKLKRFKDLPYLADISFEQPKEYFERIDDERKENDLSYPDWRGELYLEYHRGTYTSQAKIKNKNRRLEEKIKKAEILNTIYQQFEQKEIEKIWQIILTNQFHDIIPGSSIKEVYQDVNKLYKKAEKKLDQIIEINLEASISNKNEDKNKKIKSDDEAYLLIWNSLSNRHSRYFEIELNKIDFNFSSNFKIYSITEEKEINFEIKEKFDSKKVIKLYFDKLPSLAAGIIKFKKIEAEKEVIKEKSFTKKDLKTKELFLENKYYSLKFDNNAILTSIYDKEYERELIKENRQANKIQFFVDKPARYDAWEIEADFAEKEIKRELKLLKIKIIESALEKRALVFWEFRDSAIKQEIILPVQKKRIDFETEINWLEREILVKTAFDLDLLSEQASYEIAFGRINRPTTNNTDYEKAQFEVPAHRWANLSESNFGVSLINDCKYGYDIKNNLMRLTLLKSSNYPDPEADYGLHRFNYSIYSYGGVLRENNTLKEAEVLNEKPYFKQINSEKVEKYLEKEKTPLKAIIEIISGNSRLSALKKSEADKAIILRFYEPYGGRDKLKVKIADFLNLEKIEEVNLLENPVKSNDVNLEKNIVSCKLNKFEIKTIKLYLK